ncbi:alpha/beta hydrolase [Streptomyces sp. NPDC046716]|uniref:alpha/beta hydrolase n=1 Tax=Streptomyces sp. NPDC046716 TaxID=3157093 RepID=UPI003401CE0B
MPLHPEIAKFVATLPPPPAELDPVVMRAHDESHVAAPEDRLPLHAVEDMTAATPHGDVPVRVYTPTKETAQGLLAYFHGGAFFLGSLETHDHVARSLAKATGRTVVSVGYRLAPENAFPAGLEDCYGVVRWAAENGAELGWNGARLAIAGDSSGGTFVAAIAAMAHDDGFEGITHQVLYYPSLDLDFDEGRYTSLRENAVGYGMETASLKPFNAFYVNSGADPADPRVSPLKRADLAGLPKALVVTAEFDPLRDEGELYGRRLADAGVDATVSRYDGAGHGFVQHFGGLPEYRKVFEETAAFLNGDDGR